ncbi:uncharacterized protein PGTG_15418 [Puccinia graminis f. sp. tritici CRL 75-36-700-3]|uniref:Uncharacterized protein n=1 Tax=Puccinia graminis f. sp. tritici (strain CRL 75-36-700-3 / race SCCL) TaxID=418459 RepID=E3KZN7_PUCGT|nr:uncharacterized protein PGTG_15418 [Puccinia graminis f. sp. tritici CRL 75-36-700-3]EFP89762.1 hypothetical protein PGTG_15418 [Puccinia graminis f. sp. tritici CRL 75-36-700-3]
MANERNSYRDLITWGSTLDYEPSRSRAGEAAVPEGQDEPVARTRPRDRRDQWQRQGLGLSLSLSPDRKALETSLQRTSGVSARIFSGGLRDLPRILEVRSGGTSSSASPRRKASASKGERAKGVGLPSSSRKAREEGSAKPVASGSVRKKEAGVVRSSRETLMNAANTPLKRPASALVVDQDEDDDVLLRSSPTAKRRSRRTDESSGPPPVLVQPVQTIDLSPGSATRTPRPQNLHNPLLLEPTTSVRTIRKTPLALPIHRPHKPMSIFHSHPLLNPSKPTPTLPVNFSDWNWKSNLFHANWSLDDILEWERWNQKALESSLS